MSPLSSSGVEPEVLAGVARAAGEDAGVEPDLLGSFLPDVCAAVRAGRPITQGRLEAYAPLGDLAARRGVALRALVDLYLSAAWRVWRELPRTPGEDLVVTGEVVLHAADDVVATLCEGYQLARRAVVRAEEAARHELFDDLLSGTADVAHVVERAAHFGLDLTGPHAVAVVRVTAGVSPGSPLVADLERDVRGRKGDAPPMVATRQGRLVIVFAAPDGAAVDHVLARVSRRLERAGEDGPVAVGRPGAGVAGVVRSHAEALGALDLAERLGRPGRQVRAEDLLVHQLLLRDPVALRDLAESQLAPLRSGRGGAGPLVDTLNAFYGCGSSVAQAARDLDLSERTVRHRLGRIRELTGRDPTGDGDRLGLQLAALGAQLVGWV